MAAPPPPLMLSHPVTVDGGSYPGEVGWSLSCNDGATLSGGNPFAGSVTVAIGSTCTLDMSDSWGDGWNGASWVGLQQVITLSDGKNGVTSFVMHDYPPAPPVLPPSPPAPPHAPPASHATRATRETSRG